MGRRGPPDAVMWGKGSNEMTRRSVARVFGEEEQPTGKFASEQLDALVARSLEKSTMFNASLDGPSLEVVAPPVPAQTPGPTQSSPEFLGKSAAVLVLPAQPEPVPEPKREAPAPLVAPPPVATALTIAVPVARPRRTTATRSGVIRRPSAWRHVVKLALLAMVVASQPWWWNVGDLHGRAPAATNLVR